MNDQHSPGPGQAAGPTAPASDAAVSLRRRRLLKIGAGAAPTALLLVGRPVHAQYACATPSAWGSYMVNPANSVQARMQSKDFDVLTWSVADWQSNGAGLVGRQPWGVLFGTGVDPAKTVADANLQMQLSGIAGTATLVSILNGGSAFQQSILVAALNVKLRGGPNGLNCLPRSTLESMSQGFYTPAPGAKDWGPDQIISYLHYNGVAIRPSAPARV